MRNSGRSCLNHPLGPLLQEYFGSSCSSEEDDDSDVEYLGCYPASAQGPRRRPPERAESLDLAKNHLSGDGVGGSGKVVVVISCDSHREIEFECYAKGTYTQHIQLTVRNMTNPYHTWYIGAVPSIAVGYLFLGCRYGSDIPSNFYISLLSKYKKALKKQFQGTLRLNLALILL